MKFHNNILRAIFAVVLLGAGCAVATNKKVVRVISVGELSFEKVNPIQILDDSKNNKFLAKIDKYFDDDAKKNLDKKSNSCLKSIEYRSNVTEIKFTDVSKSPLFLLYSSLKLDC